MLISNVAATTGSYEKYYAVFTFDPETRRKAEALFKEYKEKGVIVSGEFRDDCWRLTDQLKVVSFSFHFSELTYRNTAEAWVGCSYDDYVTGTKTYALYLLGSSALVAIQGIVSSIGTIVRMSSDDVCAAALSLSPHIKAFLSLLPGESTQKDLVLEYLEELQWDCKVRDGADSRRVLAGLNMYFRFNEALCEYWKTASEQEKLFFFPVFLWWTLTAVIPLRCTEFLLTPRNCLTYENGYPVLTLRRSLKKGGDRKVSYRIDMDYETVCYTVPQSMANEILWYLDATKDMKETSLSTLLLTEPHYRHWEMNGHQSFGYYTYSNLSTCLRCFESKVMGIQEPRMIHLGDTRHLAMIGLILSGGSPLICKELAGHDDINISAHYYSNISSFIECATFEFYRNNHGRTAEFSSRRAVPVKADRKPKTVAGGYCDSAEYEKGEITDCIKIIGVYGELGDCRHCPYFMDGKSGAYLVMPDVSERKKQVDQDSEFLIQTIESVRRGIGLEEDLKTAMLRLSQSGALYRQSLIKKMEDEESGKTQKNDR